LLVFDGGELQRREEVAGVKTRKSKQGGWAQQRYQRHLENYHVQHVKEVVNVLEKVVLQENIQRIFVAGDEVVLPLVREQFTQTLKEKMADVLKLDINTPEHQVLAATIDVLRKLDAKTDAEKVDTAIGEYRARGLGVIGARPTLEALRNGQVDELLIVASPDALTLPGDDPMKTAETLGVAPPDEPFANQLVTLAQQTAAKVTFIEDATLLARAGGVAALLRYRL
jgi:peptide subunit release factor 1 (eRF1)